MYILLLMKLISNFVCVLEVQEYSGTMNNNILSSLDCTLISFKQFVTKT